jgi:hypothetical protein
LTFLFPVFRLPPFHYHVKNKVRGYPAQPSIMSSTTKARHIAGHCACGSLRYRIDVTNIDTDLVLSGYCHCSQCQRLNGAPYVWTNHWQYKALTWDPPASGPPPGAPELPKGSEGHFSPNMQTYELMKGRKWKLRCKYCGSPVGSWNAAKFKWTIWPSTLERKQVPGSEKPDTLAEGDYNVPDDIMSRIRGNHHQFYGPWRSVTINDDLEKWTGYKGDSIKVSSTGEPIQKASLHRKIITGIRY